MRHLGIALALALSVSVAGCVQTRQFADLQFTVPQGDYRLLVMRPDVTVNSVTTGGMPEPRADWTEQARPASSLPCVPAVRSRRHLQILARRMSWPASAKTRRRSQAPARRRRQLDRLA